MPLPQSREGKATDLHHAMQCPLRLEGNEKKKKKWLKLKKCHRIKIENVENIKMLFSEILTIFSEICENK